MYRLKFLSLLICLTSLSCKKSDAISRKETVSSRISTDTNGFSYQSIANDPTGLRLYTLDNGLKVYLSKNEEAPKIQTLIAIKAGSTFDPKDNTGLAHYLEHMVFKGTDQIGTLDFAKEKRILDQIEVLYEKHKQTNDLTSKSEIYKQIDSLSLQASEFAIANEYDKIANSIGAEGTNAFTSHEQTVYVNRIPSNALDTWLKVESERFSQLVLRLFHTELEAVYEEFNRGQDKDSRKQYQALLQTLFPTHPYGTQTTIGKSEHLKNPSMRAIHKYFNTYYVPNNMAIIMVGDLDFETTIKKVNRAFGAFRYKAIPSLEFPKEKPISKPIQTKVYGPTAASVYIGFRSAGFGSKEELLLTLIDYLLANSQAGLIDLNLNQKQKVQRASSFTNFNTEYGMHVLYGIPKDKQTLDEVKNLLLQEIENIKQGKFEDWMIPAVVNDLKLSQIRQFEGATATAYAYLDAFVHQTDWKDRLDFLDDMKKITKAEVMAFAQKHYQQNYVEIHKIQGKDPHIVKVENPKITPIKLNRNKESQFLQSLKKITPVPISPKFVDYAKQIQKSNTENGLPIAHVENKTNALFELNFIFDIGKDHDKRLPIATDYFKYLGTEKFSAASLKKEFYKLGISYFFNSTTDQTYVGITGLQENLEKGLALLMNFWKNAIPNQDAYNKFVAQIAKSRQDSKTQKQNILWNGLVQYGKYGQQSRLRNIFSIPALREKEPKEFVTLLQSLQQYPVRIFYYGNALTETQKAISKYYQPPSDFVNYPQKTRYTAQETGNKVYFVDYDMVQTELIFLAKDTPFSVQNMAMATVFNSYFGRGLSSIVFQEIRESKSLAYSAFSSYQIAKDPNQSNYSYAYIGTQANKMPQAISAMLDLMRDMPQSAGQFAQAKKACLKKIATKRITKSNIFWSFEKLKKRGLAVDYREKIYAEIQKISLEDLNVFFEKHIKNGKYTVLVIGNRKEIDTKALSKLGKVEELKVDTLFNY